MSYLIKKYPFNPPRPGDAAPSLYPTREAQARNKLEAINDMLASTTDPEARAGLERRKRELERELAKYDAPRQARARKMWHSLIEKRANTGLEIR